MKVTAAVVERPGGPFELQELELGEPRADEVLVRVAAAGICHTDLVVRDQLVAVPLPAVLGHEGAGVVEAVGAAVTKVKPGDRVAMSYATCGACRNCLLGRPTCCDAFWSHNFAGARPDGSTALSRDAGPVHGHFFSQSSFATHALARERNVVRVRDDVPPHLAAPLGCGIQTGAGTVLNVLRPRPGSSLVVFGTGAVGTSAIMAACLTACTTIVGVDVRAGRLELARELGATHVVDASSEDDVAAAVRELTGGGADYALETTAAPGRVREAVDCLRLAGVCCLVGAAPSGATVELEMNSIMHMRVVRGAVEGDSVPDLFVPALLELHAQGRFPFDRLIGTFPFERIEEAVRASEDGSVVKPVLLMEG